MNNMNELRQHYRAVGQTRQITNAMYLLATAQMKKSMQNIGYNLEYMKRLRGTMKDILSKTKRNDLKNRFIMEQDEGRALFVAVTADKGMCGSYNADVVKKTLAEIGKYEHPILCSLGSIGSQLFVNKGYRPDYTWTDTLQHPSVYLTKQITRTIIDLYIKHEVKEAYIVYTEYVNSAVQQVVCRRFLPLLRRDFLDLDYEYNYSALPIYEPSVEAVFEHIVPEYLVCFLYDVLMQAATCENSARMNAMQNATKNADEMIADLSQQISAMRQLAITNEITEIAAAGEIQGAV